MLIHFNDLPKYSEFKKVLNFSGGKDSLYLLLNYYYIFDSVIFADTNLEFDEVYDIVDKAMVFCKEKCIPFFVVTSEHNFFDLAVTLGVPNRRCRWCNSKLKVEPINKFLSSLYPKDKVIRIIGYTFDEIERSHKKFVSSYDYFYCFPLIDEKIDDKTVLDFHLSLGWYPKEFLLFRKHSNCWLCPFQFDDEFERLCMEQPDKVPLLININSYTEFKYRYSLQDILKKFEKK